MTTQTQKKPVFRQVRTVPLVYGEETTVELPVGVKILGVHAQLDGGLDSQGQPKRKYARTVEPQLVYLHEAEKETREVTILLLRGQAELPLDPERTYDFLGATIDRNPRTSNLATAWLVTGGEGRRKQQVYRA